MLSITCINLFILSFCFLTQIVLNRILKLYIRSIVISFILGQLLLFPFIYFSFPGENFSQINFLPIYMASNLFFLSGWYIILNFIQSTQSSIRLKILEEINKEKKKGISIDRLLSRYNDSYIFQERIYRLINGGAIKLVSGKFCLDSSFLHFFVKTMRILKRIYRVNI